MRLEIAHFIARFQSDTKGAVAIVFAGVFLLLTVAAGGAIDFLRWQTAYYRTQTAMDAAVLAAGQELQRSEATEDSVIETATKYYEVNNTAKLKANISAFSYDADRVEVSASSQGSHVETTFLNLIGFETLPVNVTSSAALSSDNVEVSLMLDVTGSMGVNNKLEDLQTAAKQLIDIVLSDGLLQHNSRIALVPFSTFVNVGRTYFTDVTGTPATGTGVEFTCVVERNNANRYTDDEPAVGGYFDSYVGLYGPIYGALLPDCPTLSTIMPLSDNKDTLKDHIETFQVAPTSTAGHLGTAWAWYTLSNKWSDIWPTESAPEAPGNVRKIAVLMTDGNYNAQFSGNSSRTQGRALCDNMKTAGITIYAVGFDVAEGSAADVTMAYCASSTDHHYNAADGTALIDAYNDIARKIYSIRLTE